MQKAILSSIQTAPAPVEVSTPREASKPAFKARAPHRTAKVRRQLPPAKVGIAWDKVRRVVRDLCRQRGPECTLCRPYGGCIEFQLTADYQPIVLHLEEDRIRATIMGKQKKIRIVRIKTGGSGYELRKKIHTATSMLIELLCEARQ